MRIKLNIVFYIFLRFSKALFMHLSTFDIDTYLPLKKTLASNQINNLTHTHILLLFLYFFFYFIVTFRKVSTFYPGDVTLFMFFFSSYLFICIHFYMSNDDFLTNRFLWFLYVYFLFIYFFTSSSFFEFLGIHISWHIKRMQFFIYIFFLYTSNKLTFISINVNIKIF